MVEAPFDGSARAGNAGAVASQLPSVARPDVDSFVDRGDPVVFVGPNQWKRLHPTADDAAAFPDPDAGTVEENGRIPRNMQKQGLDRGGFFVPVLPSVEIDRNIRLGVYLPPGYDPSSSETYPVLILLPGYKNPLHAWISSGQIIPKLDHMMSGGAQRMIVVIPDNTDSHYVNSPQVNLPRPSNNTSHTSNPSKTNGRRNYQNLVTKEIVDYATKELKGDASRLSIAGISRGGTGAVLAGIDHPGMFKSVAAMSGVLSFGLHSVERFDCPDELSKTEHDPLTQVLSRGFGDAPPPRIYIDVGARDSSVCRDTIDFAKALRSKGIGHTFRSWDGSCGAGDHTWNHWGPSFEEWIAWHQNVYGTPGRPSVAFQGTMQIPEPRREPTPAAKKPPVPPPTATPTPGPTPTPLAASPPPLPSADAQSLAKICRTRMTEDYGLQPVIQGAKAWMSRRELSGTGKGWAEAQAFLQFLRSHDANVVDEALAIWPGVPVEMRSCEPKGGAEGLANFCITTVAFTHGRVPLVEAMTAWLEHRPARGTGQIQRQTEAVMDFLRRYDPKLGQEIARIVLDRLVPKVAE